MTHLQSMKDRFEDQFVEVFMETSQWKPRGKHFPEKVSNFIEEEIKTAIRQERREIADKIHKHFLGQKKVVPDYDAGWDAACLLIITNLENKE